MSNSTKHTARKRRFSNFFAKKQNESSGSLAFIRENQGSVSFNRMPAGSYRAVFNSKTTGRKAFAYGQTFQGAYQNMIRLFNLKYSQS